MRRTPLLAALSSPRRCEILRLVWIEELSAGAIHHRMPDVTFSAVSQQLRQLLDAGMIEQRAVHRHRFYRANQTVLAPVRELLEGMWGDALWRLKLSAELDHSRRGPRRQPKSQRRPHVRSH
ncbi:MAG TPA: winged helix-turn-helix domain-containing protein [Terriglobales bacterium]